MLTAVSLLPSLSLSGTPFSPGSFFPIGHHLCAPQHAVKPSLDLISSQEAPNGGLDVQSSVIVAHRVFGGLGGIVAYVLVQLTPEFSFLVRVLDVQHLELIGKLQAKQGSLA